MGFDINFWKAEDQRDLSQQDYCVLTNPDKAINRLGRVLTVGEVACALSHRLLYEHILKLGLEEVIVLEDDVAPHFGKRDSFFNYIQQGKIEFPKVDLFLLHDASHPFKISSHKLYFSKLDNGLWGSQLLYYRRAGLEKMVLGLKQMNSVVDDWRFYFPQKWSVAMANRPLGIHLNDTTYIGNEFRRVPRKFIS